MNGHGGNRSGAGRPIGASRKLDRLTVEEKISMALDAVLAAIDNMAREASQIRLTAIQQSVISRKLEYDSMVRFHTRREYLKTKPGRPWKEDALRPERRNGYVVPKPEP